MSNVKLVLTAQTEFFTKYNKTLYFVGVSHGNILVHDPIRRPEQLKIAGFLRWRRSW